MHTLPHDLIPPRPGRTPTPAPRALTALSSPIARCAMLALLALLALQPWGAAQAQTVPEAASEPRTWLQLHAVAGTWQQRSRGDPVVLFGGPQPGTVFSAEDELGLPRQRVLPGLSFGRLIGQHWRIEVEHSASRGTGTRVLARDLAVDGIFFPAGTTLRSELGLATLGVLTGWSGAWGPNTEAGVLLGGQWVRVSRDFHSTGNATNPARDSSSAEVAPMPLLGAFGRHTLSVDWQLNGRLTFSQAGNYQLTAGAQWRAHRNLRFDLGYRVTRHQLDVEAVSLVACCQRLVLDARIHGPMLSTTLAF